MKVDVVLERLQALDHPRVIALVAAALRLLLGKRLTCLGQQALLGLELALQDLALPGGRVRPRGRGLPGERGGRLLRRHDVHLAGDELALLPGRVALVARIERPAVGVRAFVDFGDLRARRARKDP